MDQFGHQADMSRLPYRTLLTPTMMDHYISKPPNQPQQHQSQQQMPIMTDHRPDFESARKIQYLAEQNQKSQLQIAMLTVECNRLNETVNRFMEIFHNLVPQLPPATQSMLKEQIERMQHQLQANYEEQQRKAFAEFSINDVRNQPVAVAEQHQPERPRREEVVNTPKIPEISSPDNNNKDEDDDEEDDDDMNDDRASPTKRRNQKRSSSRNSISSSPVPNVNLSAGVPRTARVLAVIPHGEVVSSLCFNGAGNLLYTAGKGLVKIWDLKNSPINKPIAELRCFDAYIRSIKFADNDRALIVCGETNAICVWSMEGSAPRMVHRITATSPSFSLAVNNQTENCFYVGSLDGVVSAYDVSTGHKVKSFVGHSAPVSSIDVTHDGNKILTGSLDGTVKLWDLGTTKEIGTYNFPSQVFSAQICPGESWIAAGLENNHIEVTNLINSEAKYQLHMHENCVLSMKFANNSKWFISTSRDKSIIAWRSPFGPSIFQCREPNAVLSVDISSDDTLMATGNGDKVATLYELIY